MCSVLSTELPALLLINLFRVWSMVALTNHQTSHTSTPVDTSILHQLVTRISRFFPQNYIKRLVYAIIWKASSFVAFNLPNPFLTQFGTIQIGGLRRRMYVKPMIYVLIRMLRLLGLMRFQTSSLIL